MNDLKSKKMQKRIENYSKPRAFEKNKEEDTKMLVQKIIKMKNRKYHSVLGGKYSQDKD